MFIFFASAKILFGWSEHSILSSIILKYCVDFRRTAPLIESCNCSAGLGPPLLDKVVDG